ncbi:hypothetical protein E2C01_050295 [Portunus trituberculatus]|uniref:Uncharacterized protein n=1 Tax=Portunus trituberculatus TaxID=210409 RepID=A0A5B7GGX2_PORTR|nr:hypothetical protein [Portunus trituberculatus]
MEEQSQELRLELKDRMEQQFYQVASNMQTVQDENKQYTYVKCDSVKEEMKEYCAHALREFGGGGDC